jgi:hypothetical protein
MNAVKRRSRFGLCATRTAKAAADSPIVGSDVAPLGAGEEEQDEAHRQGEGRGPEIGLEQYEPGERADDAEGVEVAPLEVPDPRLVEGQVMGQAEHHRELRELGNLKARHAVPQPPPAALHRDSEVRDEHEDEQDERHGGDPPRPGGHSQG